MSLRLRLFFDWVPVRNLEIWNSMIAGYVQNGFGEKALQAFEGMGAEGFEPDEFTAVSVLSACAQLGNLDVGFPEKNIFCWNAMISGFAINGKCKEALEFFGRMEESNIRPDGITFLTMLSACAHGGLVSEALEVISKMEGYRIEIGIKHYGCMVDLIGQSREIKRGL
ncbi:hypothetical protein JHK87_011079 [Glycine soja]|nr:hypothetical protein JHK87_011079 [Glycine soja]